MKIINFFIFICLIILLLIFFNKNYENFHENDDENNEGTSVIPDVLPSCKSCSYCDFNTRPETKPYIISRCLKQHTTSNNFKPTNNDCRPHKNLADMSGCISAVNFYLENINNMKRVNDENRLCNANYYNDDKPIEQNIEKQNYLRWINSFPN